MAAKSDGGGGSRVGGTKRAGQAEPGGKVGMTDPATRAWDPAQGVGGEGAAARGKSGPSLREEEQRQFHATHFTADPRGAAMGGTRPEGKRQRKIRGGAPPDSPSGRPAQTARPKQRGGAGPT